MADYKRFVSYMYEYVDGVKRKNVGYVRVETRNGECKYTINMRSYGLMDGIFPTYLIHRPSGEMDLVYIGDSVAKAQIMDSRLKSKEDNIMDSGHNFSDVGGVLLFLNSSVFYGTEWDDKPITMDEVLGALKPKSKKKDISYIPDKEAKKDNDEIIDQSGKKDYASISDNLLEKEVYEKIQADIEPSKSEEPLVEVKEPDTSNKPMYRLPGGWRAKEAFGPGQANNPVNPWDLVEKYKKYEAKNVNNIDTIQNTVAKKENEPNEDLAKRKEQEDKEEKPRVIKSVFSKERPDLNKDMYTWNKDSYPQEEVPTDNIKADKIFNSYPRIYPFEDNIITRCVKLEPKDIGNLPSDIWTLSNNSFLLHGYYCYNHLIFAELRDRYGSHYILGVPGIYHNRERFMAKMFGFECFKPIRKRELKQGDFGYWYIEIKMD